MPKTKPNNYWNIQAATTEDGSTAADLYLYGLICEEKWDDTDVTPAEMVKALNALGDISEINCRIFSEGGSVFSALAIYELLKQRKETVNVYVDGLAASAATLIACAGDNVYIGNASMFMIHNVMTFIFFGLLNKTDCQNIINELDRVSAVAIRAYTEKTGLSDQEIYALLDANEGSGSWLNAEQAIELGFCDAITPTEKSPIEAVAMVRPNVYVSRGREIDLSIYKDAPKLTVLEGGKPVARTAKTQKKQTGKRGKFKAQIISTECPYCQGVNELDTATQIVTPDPSEDATVAVPMDDVVEMRASFVNEIWKITCTHCGGEYEYDSDPEGSVEPSDGGGVVTQARAKTRKVAKKPVARHRMEATTPVDITCPECDETYTIDVDSTVVELDSICPNCGAELTVDTSELSSDGSEDMGPGNEDYPNPDEEEDVIVAVRRERARIAALDKHARNFPQFAAAMDQFKANGTSVEAANNWVLTALSANPPHQTGNTAHLAALRRDAAPLNRIGNPQRGNATNQDGAEQFRRLAAARGNMKEVEKHG